MIRLLEQNDTPIIMEYLGRNEIATSFLYANIIEFGVENEREMRRCGDYYGYFEDDKLKGILPFYNLGSCIPHFESIAAVSPFTKLLKERNFEYLLGMQQFAKPLFEEIKPYKEIQEYDECSYFANWKPVHFTLDGVRFLDALETRTEEVIDFIVEARTKGFDQQVTREEIQKSLIQRGDEEDFMLAEVHGKLVAQACIQTYTPGVNQIGSVYTTGAERGKGYCKAVVSELCRKISVRGKLPTLSVKKANTPAVKAYSSLGFEHYDDYLIVRFRQNSKEE